MSSNSDARPVIIGAGLAGLSAALSLSDHEPVVLLTAAGLGEGAASGWAQGGVAAAVGRDDSPALHAADTLAAGDGLCDEAAVARITARGPAAIFHLQRLGAQFDLGLDGAPKLGLEAAHGRRRIIHANGDATGRELIRCLSNIVRSRNDVIDLAEHTEARRLLLDVNGTVAGVLAVDASGDPMVFPTSRVVIATGGLGGLYRHTTNPPGALGGGLALAARAGAALVDMEFVQFHPTALAVGRDPMPLISEAVRGEGAILINSKGERFMAGVGRAELEPRDVVARAVWAERSAGRQVYLDARTIGDRFALRFPSIHALCREAGLDPAHEPMPVRPAAHYHMGGIAVDEHGRTGVEGLWACGEVASTGLHGANRLASNSLLEAAVCGVEVAKDVAGAPPRLTRPERQALPPPIRAGGVRSMLDAHVGVLRDRKGLEQAIDAFTPIVERGGPEADAALVGLFIAMGALRREESRGGHRRTEFPDRSDAFAHRLALRMNDVLSEAAVPTAA